MANQSVVVETDDDLTRQLARFLLIAEIASQVLTCYLVVEMVERGQLSYLISWHWRRWKAKYERERSVAKQARFVMWEAHKILEESNG